MLYCDVYHRKDMKSPVVGERAFWVAAPSTAVGVNTRSYSCEEVFAVFQLSPNDVWQDVLEKLRPLHLLPGVILEWRRITNALTKVVFPLQREKRYHTTLAMDRIYPIAQTHTATGNTHTHIPLSNSQSMR